MFTGGIRQVLIEASNVGIHVGGRHTVQTPIIISMQVSSYQSKVGSGLANLDVLCIRSYVLTARSGVFTVIISLFLGITSYFE